MQSNELLNETAEDVLNLDVTDLTVIDESTQESDQAIRFSFELNESEASPEGIEEVIPEIEEDDITEDLQEEQEEFETDLEAKDIPDSGEFDEYAMLYHLWNEMIKAPDLDSLFDIILFAFMSHLLCTSASLIAKTGQSWTVALSKGIDALTEDLHFYEDRGFFPLLENNKILDLDLYKNNAEYTDYYLELLSIDGRFMIPVMHKGKLFAVILLGDRVDNVVYSKEDNYFIFSICEIAGIVMNMLSETEKMSAEISELKNNIDVTNSVEAIGEQLTRQDSLEGMKTIIREVFEQYGIESYAVWGKSRKEKFFLIAADEKSEGSENFPPHIDEKSKFVTLLGKSGTVISLDDFRYRNEVGEIFDDELLKGFRIFDVHPFVAGGQNIGFITIFGLAAGLKPEEVAAKIRRISRFIFNSAYLVQYENANYNKYTDNLESIYRRISREINNAAGLRIPLSLLLFSIKNFRRCYTLLGEEAANSVLEDMEKTITERLGDYDFSFRYGWSSFLIALPGKDKKTALQLGAAIRNAVKQDPDMSLLMTFLAVQFPDDGADVFSLLDILE
ncbi:MAG: diguanylate cyclase [Leptospirales bacterium]|nr:diguanylate cyclase [Leptospirales bacterium]